MTYPLQLPFKTFFTQSHGQIHLSEKELKQETNFLPSHAFILHKSEVSSLQ